MWISKKKYLELVERQNELRKDLRELSTNFYPLYYDFRGKEHLYSPVDKTKSFDGVKENLKLLMDYLGVERKEEIINKIVKKK